MRGGGYSGWQCHLPILHLHDLLSNASWRRVLGRQCQPPRLQLAVSVCMGVCVCVCVCVCACVCVCVCVCVCKSSPAARKQFWAAHVGLRMLHIIMFCHAVLLTLHNVAIASNIMLCNAEGAGQQALVATYRRSLGQSWRPL